MPGADGPGADSQGDSAAASVLLPSFPAMPISPNTSPTRGSTTCPAPAPGTPPSPHGPAPGQSPALAAGSPTRGGGYPSIAPDSLPPVPAAPNRASAGSSAGSRSGVESMPGQASSLALAAAAPSVSLPRQWTRLQSGLRNLHSSRT